MNFVTLGSTLSRQPSTLAPCAERRTWSPAARDRERPLFFFRRATSSAAPARRSLPISGRSLHQLSLFREELLKVAELGVFDHTLAAFWYLLILSELLLSIRRESSSRSMFDAPGEPPRSLCGVWTITASVCPGSLSPQPQRRCWPQSSAPSYRPASSPQDQSHPGAASSPHRASPALPSGTRQGRGRCRVAAASRRNDRPDARAWSLRLFGSGWIYQQKKSLAIGLLVGFGFWLQRPDLQVFEWHVMALSLRVRQQPTHTPTQELAQYG